MATSTYLTSHQGTTGVTHSYNVTLAGTFTGKLVVTVALEASSSVTSVTFDGASMTLDRSHDNGTLLKIRTFYLDLTSKAAGTYSVSIALSASAVVISSAFALTDVASGASEAFGTSNAAPGTATLTATSSAALIAATVNSSGSVTQTFSGDVTERNDQVVTGAFGAAVGDASNVAAGTRTATSTPSTGTNALLLVSYAHSGGGGGGGGGGEIRRRVMLRAPKNTQRDFKPYQKPLFLFGAPLVIGTVPPPSGPFNYLLNPLGPLLRQDALGPATALSNDRVYTSPRLRFQGLAADLVGDQDYRGFSVVLPAVTRTDTN